LSPFISGGALRLACSLPPDCGGIRTLAFLCPVQTLNPAAWLLALSRYTLTLGTLLAIMSHRIAAGIPQNWCGRPADARRYIGAAAG